ncbi:hypothetical protein [Stenotrophomonas daejeonensis]|uniref:hypothetical protein n=1 Tax=Stenotrophomonas daejeonensis TaxID=659018 RepID=UPI0009F8394A|nr:hypothetical protein [Stenotrophomonas daejeonensis]
MDIASVLTGFLVGAATGAAGQYFADKYTDQRREKKLAREQARLWQDIEQRFPAVIAEMRSDFSPQENRHVRVFFVKESNTMLGFVSEPCFEYHTDKHPDLRAAVALLEQHGFITDITPGNCPMYRVHEKLVDALLRPNNSFKPTPLRGAA